MLSITPDHEMFKNVENVDMSGYYIVGVYGNANTTFSLGVTNQDHPISTLKEGVATRHS